MKTIRLLYPDYMSGGLEQYFFGAHLMSHILPQNNHQPVVKVEISPPDGKEKRVIDGIYGKNEVISGIKNAIEKIEKENPDKIITIGGNCIVSLAPFDYLHGKYDNVGIIWIDAHPDVSTVKNGYPNAHAMVLGSLMGYGDKSLSDLMKNKYFQSDEILYVGLQDLHDYQRQFLDEAGVNYKIQTNEFVSDQDILSFIKKHENILVHFDVDVLDEKLFHSTYFANDELTGDGSGGGKMTFDQLERTLHCITENANVVGFTIAEYLPFDEYKLYKMFSQMNMFTE